MKEEIFQIDIEKILRSRTKMYVPRFLINYLKKIACQDGINECIATAEHPSGIHFFTDALKYLNITFEVLGRENMPDKEDRCVFASNHPLGGPEALIIGELMRQEYGEAFRVPVNNILAALKPLSEFFVPVNAISNKQSRNISEGIASMFQSPYQVLVYPAGKCSRLRKGLVSELPWKKMFITQAKKYKRDVIPVHCSGINSKRFYRLTLLSEKLGLKMNLGMLYLVDELFKHRNEKFVITIGEKIPYTIFDKSKTDIQWAEYVREKVKNLGKNNNQPQNMGL